MKYKLLSICSIFLPFMAMAQEAGEMGIDEKIDKVFGDLTGWFVNFIFYQIPFSENIKIYWVLFPLILGAQSTRWSRHRS